jgi:hypothetical protein
VSDFRATDLARLLGSEVLDADDAAQLLGIERGSLEYAAYRKRIAYVQYGAKKLFARADLLDYRAKSGRGRESQLQPVEPIVVKR